MVVLASGQLGVSMLMCAVNLHEGEAELSVYPNTSPFLLFISATKHLTSTAVPSSRTLSDDGNVPRLHCLRGASETEELDFEFDSTLTWGIPISPKPLGHGNN